MCKHCLLTPTTLHHTEVWNTDIFDYSDNHLSAVKANITRNVRMPASGAALLFNRVAGF